MAAQVEVQTGEVGRTGVGGRLHMSPLSDSSNSRIIQSNVITPEPNKPVPGPKPRLTPRPFAVDRNPTVKPIVAPKPFNKLRPESTRLSGHKPEPPCTEKPAPADPNRPTANSFKTSNKLFAGQTTKPVVQPFKPAPPLDLGHHKKPAEGLKPSGLVHSHSLKRLPAAEWSGTTTEVEEKDRTVTRTKSMGFLADVGKEEGEDPDTTVPLRPQPRGSRPRPTSAIFHDSPTKVAAPVPAPRLAARRPLSADLTSKFESIGLSLPRKSPSMKENTEDRTPPQRTEGAKTTTAQSHEDGAALPVSDLSSRNTEDVKEGDERRAGSIKSRISLLLDSASVSPGSDLQSATQSVPESEPALGVKQLIKQLTEDTTQTQSPFSKPQVKPRPRPLPLDLTKRFSSDRSPDLAGDIADRHDIISKDAQWRNEESAVTPGDQPVFADLQASMSEGPPFSSDVQTVRVFENVVERHSVLMVDGGKPANRPKGSLSSLSFKRGNSSDEGTLVTATYKESMSPSSPLRVAHAVDTVKTVEEIRAVSESVPSAQWEDKAVTLRSRRSEGNAAQQQPRELRVGALQKWNVMGLEHEVSLEKDKKEAKVEQEEPMKMLKAEEQPKPRATFFALTGQMQEMFSSPPEESEFSVTSPGKFLPARSSSLDQEFGQPSRGLVEESFMEVEKKKAKVKELEREKQRQLETEKDALLEFERMKQREVQREAERQRQRALAKQKQLELQELERQRQKNEREKQRQWEEETLRELERQRQKELEWQRQREEEKQKELEKQLQREEEKQLERQQQMEEYKLKELERQRQREKEKQKELERQRQRDLERQMEEEKQKELDKERLLLEIQKEKQRLVELQRRKEKEHQMELEKQRLREKKEREEAERLKQMALEQEVLRMREIEKEQERQREMEKEVERQRQRDLEWERQRQLDMERRELENQRQRQWQLEKERQRREEIERIKEMERRQFMEFEKQAERAEQEKLRLREETEKLRQKQQEAQERQRLKEKQERARLEASALKPTVVDLDSVLQNEPLLKTMTRWKEPMGYKQVDVFGAQLTTNKDPFTPSDSGVGTRSQVVPERDISWKVPSQTAVEWTLSPQDPWELRPVEMSVDQPVAEPRKQTNKLSPEQLLPRWEERLLAPQKNWSSMLDEPLPPAPLSGTDARSKVYTSRISAGVTAELDWLPKELQPQDSRRPAQVHRRSQGSQELSRMRSRSVSRRSAPSGGALEGSLSRMRSRSAHREDRHSWVQQKQSHSSENEGRDAGETLVQESDSQYGTWETGLHSGDSLTPLTPSSESNQSPSTGKPTPTHTPGESTSLDHDAVDSFLSPSSPNVQLPSFPDAPPTLLDTSALRSRAQLAKKRAPRSRPSRAALQNATVAKDGDGEDWLYRDSTEPKVDSQESEEEPIRGCDSGQAAAASQPQRVALFPGMDPSALKAQLKKRGESDNHADGAAVPPSQLSRSPKSPFLPRAARVLPPAGGKDNGEEDSPQWLKELKSKKRLSQYDGES